MSESIATKKGRAAGQPTIKKQPRRIPSQDAVAMALYLTTDFPVTRIAEQIGINPNSLSSLISSYGWKEAKDSYKQLASSIGARAIESRVFSKVAELRSKQAAELECLCDKVYAHIQKLQCPETIEDTMKIPEHLLQTPKQLHQLAEAYRSAQKSLNSALGIADTIDVSLDITAMIPQGVLDTTRQDIVPEWQGIEESIGGKTDTSLDECQAFETPVSIASMAAITQGEGVGQDYPPGGPDRLTHSASATIFSDPTIVTLEAQEQSI